MCAYFGGLIRAPWVLTVLGKIRLIESICLRPLPSYDTILAPPPIHTVYVYYTVYLFTQERARGEDS